MKCNHIKPKIPQWLDGELEAGEATSVAEHVDDCLDCQKEVAFWCELSTVLKEDLGEIKAPPGFANSVMAQLNDRPRKIGLSRLAHAWKRNLAVAAAFLIMAAGSIGAYIQMGGDIPSQIAKSENQPPAQVAPLTNPEQPGATETEPNTGSNSEGLNEQPSPSEQGSQVNKGPNNGAGEKGQESAGVATPDNINNEQPVNQAPTASDDILPTPAETAEEYALLNTEQNRVIERTLVRVTVEDMAQAHNQALSLINNSGAQYEVIGSENTPGGGMTTLKVVVHNDRSVKLEGEFKTLGAVVATNRQQEDLNSRYNEQVEQYRSLEAQVQTAKTLAEKNQLAFRMAGIKNQLMIWAQEADSKTIILLLEN